MEEWLERLKKPPFFLMLIGFASLLTALYMLYKKEATLASISFAGGFMAIIFSSLSNYEYFEGLGIKAKLKSEVNEAKELIEKLKVVNNASVMTSSLMLKLITIMGRLDSYIPALERISIAKELVKAMEAMGANKETISHSLKPFDKAIEGDIIRAMRHDIEAEYETLKQNKGREEEEVATKERNDYIRSLNNNSSWTNEERIEKLKDLVLSSAVFEKEQKQILINIIEEYVLDITFYQENREARRPDLWEQKEL